MRFGVGDGEPAAPQGPHTRSNVPSLSFSSIHVYDASNWSSVTGIGPGVVLT